MALKIKKVAPSTTAAVKTSTRVAHGKTGAEVVKEEILAMTPVPSVYANVGLSAARTINLGDFNSVKLGVDIHHPCEATPEAIEATYKYCFRWLDEKMQALTKDHDADQGQD